MQRISRILLLALTLTSMLVITIAHAEISPEKSMVGRWKTIDDVTGKPKAIVNIQKAANGEYFGVVEETFTVNGIPPVKICEKCSGERKNQPVIGMTILWGMTEQAEGSYSGGQILDPKNGHIYRCIASLEDEGKHLLVRGYLGISLLGRTQTWIREQS